MMAKEPCKFALITCLLLYTFNVQSQTINYVNQENMGDVNVCFVDNKIEADGIVYVSSHKSYSKKLGIWYEEKFFNNRGIKVFISSKNKADVKVYLTKWRNEVKINETYKQQFNITL